MQIIANIAIIRGWFVGATTIWKTHRIRACKCPLPHILLHLKICKTIRIRLLAREVLDAETEFIRMQTRTDSKKILLTTKPQESKEIEGDEGEMMSRMCKYRPIWPTWQTETEIVEVVHKEGFRIKVKKVTTFTGNICSNRREETTIMGVIRDVSKGEEEEIRMGLGVRQIETQLQTWTISICVTSSQIRIQIVLSKDTEVGKDISKNSLGQSRVWQCKIWRVTPISKDNKDKWGEHARSESKYWPTRKTSQTTITMVVVEIEGIANLIRSNLSLTRIPISVITRGLIDAENRQTYLYIHILS